MVKPKSFRHKHTHIRGEDYLATLKGSSLSMTHHRKEEEEPKKRFETPRSSQGQGLRFYRELLQTRLKKPMPPRHRVTNVNFTKDENHSGQ